MFIFIVVCNEVYKELRIEEIDKEKKIDKEVKKKRRI
jgi:hypothetical protein